jgi:hypothetical protein
MSLTEISARFAISGSEFGVTDVGDGESRFRLWAPAARQVDIVIEGSAPFAMERSDNGWFETTTCCSDGVAYEFILDDNLRIFDPAARAVRTDTQIRSVVYDSRAYSWRTPAWKGRPWSEAVLYELHVGVLKGFCGVMELLPRLAELGVTAIELMPVNAFPGARNWGYDGVLQFAPCPAYGTPDELKALVDRAHELGLMMFLMWFTTILDRKGIISTTTRRSFFETMCKPRGAGASISKHLKSAVSLRRMRFIGWRSFASMAYASTLRMRLRILIGWMRQLREFERLCPGIAMCILCWRTTTMFPATCATAIFPRNGTTTPIMLCMYC